MSGVTDHLMAEPLLIARIEDQVPDLRAVLSAADLAGVKAASQVTPAVHVLYGGDDVPTREGDRGWTGKPQKILQRWMAVVAVRNARTQRTGAAAREDAGPLLSQLIGALAGFQLDPALGPLKRIPAPQPAYDAGFAYFPTLWTTEFYVP